MFPASQYQPFDCKPFCPEKDLFQRKADPSSRAYAPVWPAPLPPLPLTFAIDSLNRAASCLRLYLDLLDDGTKWYHVTVPSKTFPAFLRAMDQDDGRTRTLPFSCWCDAGTEHHRHLILSTPPRRAIDSVWHDLLDEPENLPEGMQQEPILDALHLIRLLGYLSRRESLCSLSDVLRPSLHHFYIFESLPRDFGLALAVLYPDGLRRLLDFENRRPDMERLVRAPMTLSDQTWRLKIGDIPGIPFGKTLPLSEEWVRSDLPTDVFLHLLEDRKAYLKRSPQRRGTGIAFYDVVSKEPWTPRPFLQRLIHVFKPVIDRNGQLEAENAQLKKEAEDTRNELSRLKRKYEASVENVKSLIKRIHWS